MNETRGISMFLVVMNIKPKSINHFCLNQQQHGYSLNYLFLFCYFIYLRELNIDHV